MSSYYFLHPYPPPHHHHRHHCHYSPDLCVCHPGQNTSSSSSSSLLRQSELVMEPRNLTVLSGQQARFNCSTTTSWDNMLWRLDDRTVVIIPASSSGTNNSAWMAVNCSTAQVSCWELVLKKVVRINAMQPRRVTCELFREALGDPTAPTTAALHIQGLFLLIHII